MLGCVCWRGVNATSARSLSITPPNLHSYTLQFCKEPNRYFHFITRIDELCIQCKSIPNQWLRYLQTLDDFLCLHLIALKNLLTLFNYISTKLTFKYFEQWGEEKVGCCQRNYVKQAVYSMRKCNLCLLYVREMDKTSQTSCENALLNNASFKKIVIY